MRTREPARADTQAEYSCSRAHLECSFTARFEPLKRRFRSLKRRLANFETFLLKKFGATLKNRAFKNLCLLQHYPTFGDPLNKKIYCLSFFSVSSLLIVRLSLKSISVYYVSVKMKFSTSISGACALDTCVRDVRIKCFGGTFVKSTIFLSISLKVMRS